MSTVLIFKDTRNCTGEKVGKDMYDWTLYHMSAASSICEVKEFTKETRLA
jgi:hypothetical protein